jgi:hypothetical protein
MSAPLRRVDSSSATIIHIGSTKQSEGSIHTQESTITTEKVSDVAECVICSEPRTSDQRPTLIHKTNQDCDAHKNRRICYICLPQLDNCPLCRENLATGEMQNSLADVLVEMQQNNPQKQKEAEESEINVQNQHRPGFPYEIVCALAALVAVGVGGYLCAWALDTHK